MDGTPTAPQAIVGEASASVRAPLERVPLVLNQRNLDWVTNRISAAVENPTPRWWWVAFAMTSVVALIGFFCLGYLISTGVGTWGNNIPVGWAWGITNFVFWIGIGHAGTLISAILYLLRQKWRTSINRSAEAMTLFAVMCAAIFPAVHIGRVWMAWFLAPVPTQYAIWPNFRSPLLWDVFAVSTYFTVSVLFWYTGLVPDLGTLRDRAQTKTKKFFYGLFALGWRGSNRNWRHYEMAYLLLAGLSTPLVLSVHSTVSFDFATSVIPTWHTTIFPPYFVAGAIFGGFAMVLTLMIPARAIFGLKDIISPQHIDKMAKIILLTGSIVAYSYMMEFFISWYSGNQYERFAFYNRIFGTYWWFWWVGMLFCNCLSPQLFWFRWCRRNIFVVYFVCMCVNAGMWFERFIIIVGGITRDFLPSAWRYYTPSWVDIWTFVGTFGIFLSLFLIFIRFAPMIAMSEVKLVLPESDPHRVTPEEHHVIAAGGMERN
ncbi:MAG TPA: NrfD/PsrC family molybdoenzyme membrane anchor subunit [Chthoniobacterales bacterium]|nr:NrfD/PsrC family molybdoenzyme membrane anchor subunit [Chthoniobacterales bacterium]